MKKILIALLFSVCLNNMSTVKGANLSDTLSYLQTIVANKANYIGKPFTTLLNDLQIQIKYFCPLADIPYDKSKETKALFGFYFPQTENEIHLTYPCLRIFWQPYLNASTSHYLYTKYDGGGWTQEVIDFYSTAIIKDIQISE